MFFCGIDIGTGGVRSIISDERGRVSAHVFVNFPQDINLMPKTYWFEQDPTLWWTTTKLCINKLLTDFKLRGHNPTQIDAVSIDGTSGTVVFLDDSLNPLRNAIMYKDIRSHDQSQRINEVAGDFTEKLGYQIQPSFAISKILWVKENEEHIYSNTRFILHQADYISAKLTNKYDVSDHSNALKTAFDLIDYGWPAFIEKDLGLDLNKLPIVLRPGDVIAPVSLEMRKEFGFKSETMVTAGMTDACASMIASGAIEPGDWNSTIGTTFAVKGVTKNLIKDDMGRIYSHLHPQGYWMPGGASSTGGEALALHFLGRDLAQLDDQCSKLEGSSIIMYPLLKKGERFPFNNIDAEGFTIGEPKGELDYYLGHLEGIALLERFSYEMLKNLGAEIGDNIYVTGGGSKSTLWNQVRADMLGKKVIKPIEEETCMGSTIIAASKTCFKNVTEAARSMVSIEKEFIPKEDETNRYEAKYDLLKEEFKKRGYI
ncbi:MAG: FGGY-family carbohydrate kinase [Actinobacteria bacterium]|nr:FGGY-family carbohydrate kinase [Actinomycetota bacterium]